MTHRRVGSHELNLESSRSHSIMTVFVESSPTNQQVSTVAAALNKILWSLQHDGHHMYLRGL